MNVPSPLASDVPVVGQAAFKVLAFSPLLTVICESGACPPFHVSLFAPQPCPRCGTRVAIMGIRYDRRTGELGVEIGRAISTLVAPSSGGVS